MLVNHGPSQQSSKEEYKPWKWGATARYYTYKDHITNEQVRAKIQQAIGPHEDLLAIVKRRKLQWYGHVSRSSGLAKTILQGTVKGGRRQGRQRFRWEDNIKEWTGLEFGKAHRAAENSEKWRKLVEESSVVPQRHSRWESGSGSGKGTTFPCDVSGLCADQRSRVRGYDNSLPLSFRFSPTAAFLPEWIRNTISTLFVTCT